MTSLHVRLLLPSGAASGSSTRQAIQERQESAPIRLTIDRGRIVSMLPLQISLHEAEQLPFAGPGLFDLQVNGYGGTWFSSEQLTVAQVQQVLHDLLQQGVTRCLPTLITNSAEALIHGLQTIRSAAESDGLLRRVIAGCHVEGPFISPRDGPRGAHPEIHVRPADIRELQRWQNASGGLLKLVTLAPEVDGADLLIPAAVAMGVTIAIGHTAASPEQIRAAASLGARLGTHLGNGCSSLVPRHDNVFWPQLADDRLTCSVIADGFHVPADMLTCILRCKGADRIVLTSDVSGFGGCPPGHYATGDVQVEVLPDGRIVVAGQTRFLAGSGASTGDCIAGFMHATGLDPGTAWRCASEVPARLLGGPFVPLQEGSAATLTLFRLKQLKSGTPLKYQPVSAWVDGTEVRAR